MTTALCPFQARRIEEASCFNAKIQMKHCRVCFEKKHLIVEHFIMCLFVDKARQVRNVPTSLAFCNSKFLKWLQAVDDSKSDMMRLCLLYS